ncbi:MAG: hypothetical protein IAI50_01990 [Candidatus Eremiobacteraeota bacterium]|nr:hypothetical protein [Candidatus Eremiobacteraeota bacterium]
MDYESELHPRSFALGRPLSPSQVPGGRPREALPNDGNAYPARTGADVIRSIVYRNVLSAILLIVAIAGIVVQIREIHQGIIFPQTRLTLIAYFLIAIYAAASIALRLRATFKDKR